MKPKSANPVTVAAVAAAAHAATLLPLLQQLVPLVSLVLLPPPRMLPLLLLPFLEPLGPANADCGYCYYELTACHVLCILLLFLLYTVVVV